MADLTRRNFRRFIGASYAFAALSLLHVTFIEPFVLARVKRQALALPNWPDGLKLMSQQLAISILRSAVTMARKQYLCENEKWLLECRRVTRC